MKHKDWSKFRLHPSSISKVMTHPSKFKKLTIPETKRLDKYQNEGCQTSEEEDYAALTLKQNNYLNPPEISEGAKTHLLERYSKEKYDTKRAPYSVQKPQQSKGSALEVEAADLLSRVDGVKYQKLEFNESNDFLLGKADLISPKRDRIVETKISWSTDTFFPHHQGKLAPSIWFQVQAYLELYNIDYAQVCYILVNTPPHLIEQEKATIYKKYLFGETTREKYDYSMSKLEGVYDYNKIPMKRRIIRYEIERYKQIIPAINNKVMLCREWLAEFDKIHLLNRNIITLPEQYVNSGAEEDNT